ncbi:MAG TPA: hypothetical protein DER09_13300 [Prolixibacteraceae bacterium]|nr:hypothetical protein [Prolixibacteraceae bacterium]
MRFSALLCVFVISMFTSTAQVKMKKTVNGLLFTERSDSVLLYRNKLVSIDGKFTRTHYIHPLWAPDGKILTEDFPIDHPHHRGIFWAWHQIVVNGKNICDGWELKNFSQKINDLQFRALKNGSAELKTEVEWASPNLKNESGKLIPMIQEKTKIIIHPAVKNYRKIDFEISLLALVENLSIGGSADEKGYSGFSARIKLPEDVVFKEVAGNVLPQNTAVVSPGYIDISGGMLKNGKPGGVVIVDFPENPGYPQPWILRAKNSMQNAAWPGNQLVQISTKEPLVLKYSLLVYSGEMKGKTIQKMLQH